MLAIERKNQILTILQDEKKVVVAELSAKFGVSEETIRRDLEKLEKEGYVVKAYGGAVLNDSPVGCQSRGLARPLAGRIPPSPPQKEGLRFT